MASSTFCPDSRLRKYFFQRVVLVTAFPESASWDAEQPIAIRQRSFGGALPHKMPSAVMRFNALCAHVGP
jgi:hypothetical protein